MSFDELTGKAATECMNNSTSSGGRNDSALCSDSTKMRKIVERVWQIQQGRLGEGRYNSRMTNDEIKRFCKLAVSSEKLVKGSV